IFARGSIFFEKLPRHADNRKGDKTNRGSCHRLKKAFNNMGYSVCNCAQSGMKCQILLTFVSISYLCTAKDSRTSYLSQRFNVSTINMHMNGIKANSYLKLKRTMQRL